ncbi:hypothetical protein BGX38DRAFT_1264035 [Terfezia claveryi]|nr:hypothetical protein BGX38DRAFT_1264035 [Terfezia claveryi]
MALLAHKEELRPYMFSERSCDNNTNLPDLVFTSGSVKLKPPNPPRLLVAVGNETRIKSYITKARRHAEGASKFRSVVIRELCALIYTYIGYELVPEPLKDTNTGPSFDYNTASFIITRSEYSRFLHANAYLVARTLHLHTNSDAHSLLKLLNVDFHNALNSTVHNVTLSDALEAIYWLGVSQLCQLSGRSFSKLQSVRVWFLRLRT